MSTYETLLLEIDGPIATVTLNRPAVLNALNAQVFNDLESAITLLAADPAIRAILITFGVSLVVRALMPGLGKQSAAA